MPNKLEASYDPIFQFARENVIETNPDGTVSHLAPKKITVDFEPGMRNALKRTWNSKVSDTDIQQCWFHYEQVSLYKIQLGTIVEQVHKFEICIPGID